MPRRYDDDDDDLDDDDDRPRRRPPEMGWLDQQFTNTNIVILILFSLCCGQIALIFGILGVLMCKNKTARTNATIVLVISGVSFCLSIVVTVAQVAMKR